MQDLHARRIGLDLSTGFERHWHAGDPYRSALFNTLSMMFPAGEQFFIDSVREFVPALEQAGNEKLIEEARAFIAQEATHRHLHEQYNAVLEAQGYRNRVERLIQFRMRMSRHFHPLSRLAVVIGYEHFTAILGDGLLRDKAWLDTDDARLDRLWHWHAAEETEHKAVAFDVYQAAGGGYWRRVLWFLYMTMWFAIDVTWQTTAILWKDKTLFRPRTWFSWLRVWFVSPGILWHMLPMWIKYLAPGFHPWQHDNRALLARWYADYAQDAGA
jgi:predicted metal-dependent hydrolase